MSLIWNILLGGRSAPRRSNRRERFVYWLGNRVANMRSGVDIHPTSMIHPEAWICARGGALTIGPNSVVAMGTCIQGPVTIGDSSSVQAHGTLVAYPNSPITIGNKVRIAGNAVIISANHRFQDVTQPIYGQGMDPGPITIGDDVWVGASVNIIAGVTIGSGSVIGGGAVVTEDIPPMSVAVGVPARVVKKRGE